MCCACVYCALNEATGPFISTTTDSNSPEYETHAHTYILWVKCFANLLSTSTLAEARKKRRIIRVKRGRVSEREREREQEGKKERKNECEGKRETEKTGAGCGVRQLHRGPYPSHSCSLTAAIDISHSFLCLLHTLLYSRLFPYTYIKKGGWPY